MTTEAEILYAAPQKAADRMTAITDRLIEALRPSYELVYVDYYDTLSREQVAALVRGDMDFLLEDTFDWESDNRWDSVKYIIDELVKDELDDDERELFENDSEAFDTVRFEIEERDTSNWLKQIARNSGTVMLRIASPITEDDSLSYQEVEPAYMLSLLGLPETPKNLEAADDVIANTSTEYSVAMGYWLASVEVSDLYDLAYDATKVKITNPGFWLGNPFAGSGYADQFEGEIIVDRDELRTDKDAFGYGWQEVASASASCFPVKFEEVKE